MCYELYISANNPLKEQLKSEYVSFEQINDAQRNNLSSHLKHEFNYYIGSKAGCSCSFRYWENDFGFTEPQDWTDEDPDDIKGTIALYKAIINLFPSSTLITIIPTWCGDDIPSQETELINLDSIAENKFIIFTNRLMNVKT